jgi:hypothetical protein
MGTYKIEASVVTTGAEDITYHKCIFKSFDKISNHTLSHKFFLKNNSKNKDKKELNDTKAKESKKEMEEKLGNIKIIVILLIVLILVLTGISLYIIYKEPNRK